MNILSQLTGYWNTIRANKPLLIITASFSTAIVICCCCFIAFLITPTTPIETIETTNPTFVYETALADVYKNATLTANALPTASFTLSPTKTLTPTITITFTPTSVVSGIVGASCITRSDYEIGNVVEIIDGDTIRVSIDGTYYSIRYIGIDTPELNSDYYSAEAKNQNQALVFSKEVMLFKDESEKDPYGRLLRYVVVNNTFVNYNLVQTGHARATSYPPDDACDTAFKDAETKAKNQKIGIWAPATATPVPAIINPGSSSDNTNCSPAYPTVCIPPAPPDLDCGDIPYRRFQVLPPDPHRFDRDGDGIGCES